MSWSRIKNVLVGLEETEEGRDALEFARLMSNLAGADLHVVSVHSDTVYYEGIEEMKLVRNRYFDHLLDFAENEIGEGFEFHRVLDMSVPAGLTRIAEEINADLMIIGSSHRGPIGRVLLGDAGSRLAAGAPCPVGMVPRGWSRSASTAIRKVGVAFNGTRDSEEALDLGSAIARTVGASLELVGVIPSMIVPSRVGPVNAGYEEMLRGDMAQVLKEGVARADTPGTSSKVRTGRAADELAAESADLDLLFLGSRSYGPVRRVLLGGASFKVMRSAACPVIIVPKGDE